MALTVSDAIVQAVVQDGADRAFVFPGGGSNLDVIDALGRAGVGIVLAHSETAAVLMASVYADLIGRPALVLVGLGPGVASAVNGLAHARLDQSAVVIISDRFPDGEESYTGHQVLDQPALLAPVAKAQAVLAATGAQTTMRWALATAAAPPRGPVHLELSAGVAEAPASSVSRGAPGCEAKRSWSDPELAGAAAAVAAARRPVILVGDEALSVPQATLVSLAERLVAPVLVTPKAKGAVPEDHALWCGVVTNAALEAPLLEQADLLLIIGLDPVELLSRPWTAGAPVIALRDHDEPVAGYCPERILVGDVARSVDGLLARSVDGARDWTIGEIGAARDGMAHAIRAGRTGEGGELTAIEVVEDVQACVRPETTATVDAGAHMFAAIWGWRATRPRRFLISNGLATMGFALPAAIAAALAGPGAPVIAIAGDGGFLLHGSELETAVRVGARIIVIVLNDSGLSLIRIKQEDRGLPRSAVDFGPVDVAAYARSLGAAGIVAQRRDEVRAAVMQAVADAGPAVIDVRLSGAEYSELQRVIRVTGASAAEPLCLP